MFCACHKIGENTINILKCFISKHTYTLHVKLNIYILEAKFTFRKRYLFVPFFSRNVKRIYADQSIYKFSYPAWKVMRHTFKSSSCKKLFLQCVCYWYDLPRWMFFILFDNRKISFLIKFIATRHFFKRQVLAFFEISVLKEVCF